MNLFVISVFRPNHNYTYTLIYEISYKYPRLLSILMVVHRICCVYKPTTKQFSDSRLWVYCGGLAMFCVVMLTIPYLSNCPVSMNQRKFVVLPDCLPRRHPVTIIINKFVGTIPFFAMSLNIILILYIRHQKHKLQRVHCTTIVQNMKNIEMNMVLQSFYTTIFLTFHDLTYQLIDYTMASAS
ncbi:unnamed protein product [Caenorhabditis bovis]|uniref:Uncharacterized protein n=1 Tax=Caenorhabditis bovis TaxID=2654633 RepID=A0A8S1E7P8_9PELO|nr:unnamed protein product [Caenorhabditis bovis]